MILEYNKNKMYFIDLTAKIIIKYKIMASKRKALTMKFVNWNDVLAEKIINSSKQITSDQFANNLTHEIIFYI